MLRTAKGGGRIHVGLSQSPTCAAQEWVVRDTSGGILMGQTAPCDQEVVCGVWALRPLRDLSI